MTRTLFISAILLCQLIAVAQKKNIALTPPMGWNTWNTFHCQVDEELIRESADYMVSSGMKAAGYEYIVIDDCWQKTRDSEGRIVADPKRFPSGIKALADYIHSKGLKFGLYSDVGKMTCQRRPGSRGYEEIDAKTYEEWGVDYLKFDWCFHGNLKAETAYFPMGDALAKLDRDIVYSICNWGVKEPWKWAGETGHLWRTTGDIRPKFSGATLPFFQTVVDIIDKQAALYPYAKPGAWNDPDMLEVGHKLSISESRAHFTLWCMTAAPLMAGNDLRKMTPEIIEILTNKEVIAIDQDSLGKQGRRIVDNGATEIWLKELVNNELAICFFNRGKKEWNVELDWNALGVGSEQLLRDLWKHKEVGSAEDVNSLVIPAHDVVVFLVK
ncbi:MAG: glycoside hydrolase family 27 protein [Flavobacteriales bacterium]|nr:glycoside hydrolase family 27 protein [Flavobacteriales bacterium]